MVGVGRKENEFENQELEMTGDDVRGWEWVVTMVVPAGWECPGLSHCILQLDDRMDLNKYKSIGP